MATTKTGVKITVDTSDIDIKFLKSVDQLNASLTKSQKALGLFYNEQGLLTNALGQTVEGLSNSQIKLGQYVDELGRVHTFQGGYTEGLTKTQLALGMYADELGNVYNAMGEMVGQTDKAAKALEREAAQAAKQAAAELEALRKTAEGTAGKLDEIAKGVEDATKQLGGLGENLRSLGDELHNDTIKSAGTLIDVLLKSRSAAINIRSLGQSITSLASQLMKAKTAAQALGVATKALGGPFGMAIAAFEALSFIVNKIDPLPEIQPISDEFKKIEEHAKRAGETIKDFNDVLKHGAFSSIQTPADELKEAAAKVKEAEDALNKAKQERAEAQAVGYSSLIAAGAVTGASGGAVAGGFGAVPGAAIGAAGGALTAAAIDYRSYKHVQAAENEYKNVMAESSDAIKQYVDAARENAKTTAEKLEEEKEAYEVVLASAKSVGASTEDQAAISKKIADINGQIEKAKEEERKATLKAAGMLEYIEAAEKAQEKTAPTIEEFNAALESWKERVKEGDATQAEYNAALAAKQKEIAAQLAESYGVDAPTVSKIEIDATEKERLENELRSGAISLEEFGKQIDELRAAAQKAKDDQAEADLKSRFEADEIDADQYRSLIDELKKKRADQLTKELADEADREIVAKKWREALEANRVTQEAFDAAMKPLKEAAEREAKERQQKAEEERTKARADIESELGVSLEPPKAEVSPLDSYSENVARMDEALKAGTVDQEEYNNILSQLKEKAQAAIPGFAELQKDLQKPDAAATIDEFKGGANEILHGDDVSKEVRKNISAAKKNVEDLTRNGGSLNEESLKALQEYNDTISAAAKAVEKGVIDKEQYDAQIAAASESLANSLDKQKKEVEAAAEKERAERQRQRERTRSDLGIDSLLEEMKSPLDKYRETMDKIAAAAKNGDINREERGVLEEKAQADYWERMNELSKTAQKGAEKLDKLELGKSSASGSESLYLAQVKSSQIGYQNKMQSTTNQIAQMQSQALYESQQTNMLLAALVDGGVGVFRG